MDALRLAPNVGFTRLPFGGGVLLDGRTLALVECDERNAEIIAKLLSDGRPEAAEASELADQLVESGWLVTAPERR